MSIREVIYFCLASALGLFTFIFYVVSRNPRLKQRVWTAVHVLGGGLFLAFMLGRDLSMIGTFFTVLGTLGFIYMSLGNSRFCDACSSLIFGPERPEWRGKCPSCGVRLPWSEFYPEEETKEDAPSGASSPSSATNGAAPPPVSDSVHDEAEIARTFETEGEHHASAPPPGEEPGKTPESGLEPDEKP